MLFTSQLNSCLLLMAMTILFSCTRDDDNDTYQVLSVETLNILGEIPAETTHQDNSGAHEHNFSLVANEGFTETFESGSKGSYAGGNVSLSAGSWYLTDALLGTLSSDRKYGSKSVRIRNTGYTLFENISDATEAVLEANVDNDPTSQIIFLSVEASK